MQIIIAVTHASNITFVRNVEIIVWDFSKEEEMMYINLHMR